MTPSTARLSVAYAILRRQVLGPDASDALCRAHLRCCRVPALVRYDTGECEPTAKAGPVLMEREMETALDLAA